MNDRPRQRNLLEDLRERAKELECLYRVEEQLAAGEDSLQETLRRVTEVLPPGWQYPEDCAALLEYEGQVFRSADFEPTEWRLRADIEVQGRVVGQLSVYYLREYPREHDGPFLAEEVRLIRTVADRLAHHVLYRKLQESHLVDGEAGEAANWTRALRLLREADRSQYSRLSRRMLNHLLSIGVDEAAPLLGRSRVVDGANGSDNQPEQVVPADREVLLSDAPFELAARHLSNEELMSLVQLWLHEEKAATFNKVLADPKATLAEVAEALRRFRSLSADLSCYSRSTLSGLKASLIRRTLSTHTEFIRLARSYVDPFDFVDLFDHLVVPAHGQGTMGGKSAGLLLARWILEQARDEGVEDVPEIRVPRAWYLTSDGMVAFIKYNDLEGIVEQKYRDIDQVRQEYPNIIHLFKSSAFPPEIVKGLSVALDDFGEGTPLIVRSSSLLEDRLGTAFSGKYKSLFVANQGSKRERLGELLDAIAEVYASVFGPDPIEYRRDRGLLDFQEEMGILVQEVVGTRAGRWFLPAFAGVAFSRNEFRWSPRIRREDGIVRLVPGLGTRAVDRTSSDYPVLSVPGQPGLRANVALDEIIRYSPRWVDCIDLEDNRFTTVTLDELLSDQGTAIPGFDLAFSSVDGDRLRPARSLLTDPEREELVCNFEGLLAETRFSREVRSILDALERALGVPVDIEFAHDGAHFYLLQCRPQSSSPDEQPDPIPQDLHDSEILFSANRYVSNGHVPDLTHVVYVDPERYAELPTERNMREVGRAVGRLNEVLPKRQFALIGPGRWGSRGDIKLGVSVSYSEINNTALLVEVARKKGGYVPDLSFGTHFFQDLVESHIRYLPLYPDTDGVVFNEPFFTRSRNLLPELAPEYEHLSEAVRVIDVPSVADGRHLRVLLNAELEQAIALLCEPDHSVTGLALPPRRTSAPPTRAGAESWRWRQRMAERIAARIDPATTGVVAAYLFGSVKNGTAGPASDIDLLLHFRGDADQRDHLDRWLLGWSECLAELNYLRTGYEVGRLLDVHFVTDEDIARQTSFAAKIDAITDAAAPLPIGSDLEPLRPPADDGGRPEPRD